MTAVSVLQAKSRTVTSFGSATPEQLSRLWEQTASERVWYADIPSFEDNEEIKWAVKARDLLHVRASNRNFRLIGRLNHSRTDVDQLPFTSLTGLSMVTLLTDQWRAYANEAGIAPDIRLSLTSLVRTLSYQRCLSREMVSRLQDEPTQPKLALPAAESTHPKKEGGAIDFDLAGYYRGYGPYLTSIRLGGNEQHRIIRAELITRLGQTASPILADPNEFNPEVTLALKAAANDLHKIGLVNRVVEYPGQQNECLHVAVHPNFLAMAA